MKIATIGGRMIYFENYQNGTAGWNNHVIPYTLCIAISNFLERDFFFDHEIPPSTPPHVHPIGKLKEEIEFVMKSKPSLVSDLVKTPNRRRFEIDRNSGTNFRIENPMTNFMTNEDQRSKFGGTMIWNFFSLGREVLIKEELGRYDVIEIGNNCIINPRYFFFLDRASKSGLLDPTAVRYMPELEDLAMKVVTSTGRFNAIHLRLGDFAAAYGSDGYSVEPELFRQCIQAIFQDRDVPILVATDSFQSKEIFAKMLDGFQYELIEEIILGDFFDKFRQLPLTDFNALSVLDQLICASADQFCGTFRSTFTGVIHRLRQERFGKVDFNFFPDGRVRRHLNEEFRLVPDTQGFFEWNRYSAFSEHYSYPAWMREWNFELTAI